MYYKCSNYHITKAETHFKCSNVCKMGDKKGRILDGPAWPILN